MKKCELTRRAFLKTSAAGGLATLSGAPCITALTAHQPAELIQSIQSVHNVAFLITINSCFIGNNNERQNDASP